MVNFNQRVPSNTIYDKTFEGETFTDFMVFKPSMKVFPCFLHYLPEIISERLKSMKVFQQTVNFACNCESFPSRKFCRIWYKIIQIQPEFVGFLKQANLNGVYLRQGVWWVQPLRRYRLLYFVKCKNEGISVFYCVYISTHAVFCIS